MKKVVLGLSGGVDSAVAARLLQEQGWEVHGLYLDIGGEAARADAQSTAEMLGVPLTVQDISAALEAHVCAPFTESYLRGETPNPCILCNPAVKFRALCDHADAIGAEAIATGHYAVAKNGALYRAGGNDQSYMLCRLGRDQLARLILPLGAFEKAQVRAMAVEFGLPVANKPDSMEICFIPDKDYCGWISRRAALPGPGDFVWDGAVIGQHEGIHRWTVGQRIPGVYGPARDTKLYIRSIDAASGRIELCPDAQLYRSEFTARDFRWLIDPPAGDVSGSVKVRHTKTEMPRCTAQSLPDGRVRFVCESPVRAPARGQTAALYDGEQVLGGGIIE